MRKMRGFIQTGLRLALALCASITTANAESSATCSTDLFKCANETRVSMLEFGLRIVGEEVRKELIEKDAFASPAMVRFDSFGRDGQGDLRFWIVNGGRRCDEVASLLTNIIGRQTDSTGLLATQADFSAWLKGPVSNEVSRKACKNLAARIVPTSAGPASDEQIRALCSKIQIDVLVAKAESMVNEVKHCRVDLSSWE